MDEDEDSEDEMERTGTEYISNTPQGVDNLKKKIVSRIARNKFDRQ